MHSTARTGSSLTRPCSRRPTGISMEPLFTAATTATGARRAVTARFSRSPRKGNSHCSIHLSVEERPRLPRGTQSLGKYVVNGTIDLEKSVTEIGLDDV